MHNYIFAFVVQNIFFRNINAIATNFLGIHAVVLKLVKDVRIQRKTIDLCYVTRLGILNHIFISKTYNYLTNEHKKCTRISTIVLINICMRFIAVICLFCDNYDELENRQLYNGRPSTKQ